MSLIGWIILGLVAGYVARILVNKEGEGFIRDAILVIIGAVVGGWLFHALARPQHPSRNHNPEKEIPI